MALRVADWGLQIHPGNLYGAAAKRTGLARPLAMAPVSFRMTSLHPLHQLWRHLPPGPRRWAFSRATALLAPRPDQPPPSVRHGVAVGGEMQRASGLGEGARLMAAALHQLDIPVWTFEAGGSGTVPELPAGVPLVLHVNAPSLPAALLRLPRRLLRGRRVIGFWAWELPTATAGLARRCRVRA